MAPDPFAEHGGRAPVVRLHYLYLPTRLQGIGAAPTLLTALERLWRLMGATEIRARSAGEAGTAAFTAWSYQRDREDVLGMHELLSARAGRK